MQRRQHWIPPAGLCAGQFAHGIAWILLLVLALRRSLVLGLPALGWLHLVTLGWLTMTALTVLIHVIPSFADVPWKGERLARVSLVLFGVGAGALVIAFWLGSVATLPWAGTLVVLALVCYLIPAGRTLAVAFANGAAKAAIARALSLTLTSLFITALIGSLLAFVLSGSIPASMFSYWPQVHASFGLIGWLTVLVMGVTTRTVRPITGARSQNPWTHVVAGACEIGGLVFIVAGLVFGVPTVQWIGMLAIVIGASVYVVDLIDILRRATVAHRPPQAFVGAAAVWLIVALAFMSFALAGEPWATGAGFVFLIGWIGQMMNGHIYHIGIRLVATMARGDEDETAPGELLVSPLSWTSFALFQGAVAMGGAALVLNDPRALAVAALAGFFGWTVMMLNVAIAVQRAKR